MAKSKIEFDPIIKFYDDIRLKNIKDIKPGKIEKMNHYIIQLGWVISEKCNYNKAIKKIAKYYHKKFVDLRKKYTKQKYPKNTLFN